MYACACMYALGKNQQLLHLSNDILQGNCTTEWFLHIVHTSECEGVS